MLMATTEAFGHDIESLVINRTSFQCLRKKFREVIHTKHSVQI